ncbi:MAG: beta-ketoacyl-[acyl-carrier-protein] synthase family protein [Chitinispirillaceae bacterium]|nr:beta-ketoacyl-[acyl-carrier-protein] synthase family protein [Chitinispirillaceae bacterium]
MKRRGVVITGMGVVCSGGKSCSEFSRTLIQGTSALSLLNDPRVAHYGTIHAGLVIDDSGADTPFTDEDRYVRFADRAVGEAIAQAGIDFDGCGPRSGFFLGTCSGPMLTIEKTYGIDGERRPLDRMQLRKKQYYRAARLLAGNYHVGGPVYTVTTACSAFCAALATAADLIRAGLLEAALVAGADSFSLTTLAGFIGLKAVSNSPCAPFSRPIGLNLGEGAAAVVLEAFDRALVRAAPVIATIEGYGLSNDAFHSSTPDPTGKGAAAAMAGALGDAQVSTSDVSYINAHGTGTEANDKAETKAIKRLFGDGEGITPPVSSTKGVTGHCLGAAGAIETIAALLCAQRGIHPPTVNFSGRRDGCTLDYIGEKNRPWQTGARWLKNNFAFGGNNASVVIKNGRPVAHEAGKNRCIDEPVVLSAAGLISAAGIAPCDLTEAYFNTVSALREREVPFHGTWQVREVSSFGGTDIDRRLSLRGMDRAGMLATAAAALALKSGRISERTGSRPAIGFIMNIAQGSSWAEREHIGRLQKNRYHIDQITTFPYIVPNAVTGTVARTLSLTGYNSTFCNGPGAGLLGLVASWAAVKNGHVAALLCGAVDDLTEEGLYDCVVSELKGDRRPALGEGAVTLLLEPRSHAVRRCADHLGTIVDCAFVDDHAGEGGGKVQSAVASLLEANSIDDTEPIAISVSGCQHEPFSAIKSRFTGIERVDQTPMTGWMPASQPLFDMVAALVQRGVGGKKCVKYILIILCSPPGKTIIVLLEKNVTRKSVVSYD